MGTLFSLGCGAMVGLLAAYHDLSPLQALIAIVASVCIIVPISFKLFG